ncbi:MAG: plasmid recombination protein [Bacilli bacterium]|nr:plasmid recombination protein [Bacilli bacterium]
MAGIHYHNTRSSKSGKRTNKEMRKYIQGIVRHNNKEERENLGHTNEDIDKSRTKYNEDFVKCHSEEILDRMDKRITQICEKSHTKLKDNTLPVMDIVIPCFKAENDPPTAEDIQKANCFLKRCHEIMADHFGVENVMQSCAHHDEIHDYTDPFTGVETYSRSHLHMLIVSEYK